MADSSPSISVVICAHTEERWEQLVAAVDSVRRQSRPALEIVVVVDHNPALLERARRQGPGVRAAHRRRRRPRGGGE